MLKTDVVQVMAKGADVAFVIDDNAPFDVVAGELRDYLAKQSSLWSKGDITINVGRRMLARDELAQVKLIIETRSGLKVTRFWCSPESLDSGDFQVEAKTAPSETSPDNSKALIHNEIVLPKPPEPPGQPTVGSLMSVESLLEALKSRHNKNGARNRNRTEALFIKSTFRSGESVGHAGDVVVLADVNPGAEIRADGDIVVFGSLKGWAHAGASGDAQAVIIARELPSARMQIATFHGVPPSALPRNSKSLESGARIAYVRSRSIYVSPFAGRFARYSKGVPYDG